MCYHNHPGLIGKKSSERGKINRIKLSLAMRYGRQSIVWIRRSGTKARPMFQCSFNAVLLQTIEERPGIGSYLGRRCAKHTACVDRSSLKDISQRRKPYRSEEHTSELQSRQYLVCRLLLEKKKKHDRSIMCRRTQHSSQ